MPPKAKAAAKSVSMAAAKAAGGCDKGFCAPKDSSRAWARHLGKDLARPLKSAIRPVRGQSARVNRGRKWRFFAQAGCSENVLKLLKAGMSPAEITASYGKGRGRAALTPDLAQQADDAL